jgi:transposase-like protein
MKRRQGSTYAIDGPNADGWWNVERNAVDGGRDHARVRMQTDADGWLEIHELHLLDNGESITAERLRAFNLGTVGQMINGAALIDERRDEQPKRSRTLKAPSSRGYDNAFYEQVANAYRAALARPKPIAALAVEAGVPRSTAARWVKEARKRTGPDGRPLLGAAKPGKAGEAVDVRIIGVRAEAVAKGREGEIHAS